MPTVELALRALADPNRRAILRVIRSEARSVGEISSAVGLSQQATSHHLGKLRAAGLASGQRQGTRHLFVVRTDGLAAVRAYLDDFWPDKLADLKAAVEAEAVAADVPAREADAPMRDADAARKLGDGG